MVDLTEVHLLWHIRRDDEFGDDAKMIGVYRSRVLAEGAIVRLADQPGFRDHPDGFMIDVHGLDQDHWREGFGFD